MSSDVATTVKASGDGFFLGVSTVACDELGNQTVLHESGKEQFTKMGITDQTWFDKLKDKFDDITYYN